MGATVGNRVEVQPTSVPERIGTIEVVLSESPACYQVRWDNSRWSIISATDRAVRIVSGPKRPQRGRTPPQKGFPKP
jgi:hypothetical protein